MWRHLWTAPNIPFSPACWTNNGRHALLEEVPGSTQVDDIEDDPLVLLHVVDGEVEPEPDPGVARVRTNKEVVFVFSDEIDSAQISYEEKRRKNYFQITSFFWRGGGGLTSSLFTLELGLTT